ncbi:hypothetical protein HF324_32820 [Chitinophaga oryzae]|uniref:Uncharacterized protein n=1 Tax=Chitinophaga oryzae TaxID=2725414 RepID=A0AAE7DBA5_9BACT|nr:hypothetical protein [Chitinophaga oryzae]QJB35850.1 hypothetical protein HF329_32905 [Chitinophaga oryzae]QJB42374.1 hypothetical protein HF324_32820 [Chitinophaga oryzae]
MGSTSHLCRWIIFLLLLPLSSVAQQLKLGKNPAVINKSSVLELESQSQGLLLTRIPDTAVAPLTTAPDGSILFYQGDKSLRVRSSGAWRKALFAVDTTDITGFFLKVRSLFSAGNGIVYDNVTGTISVSGAAGGSWLLGGNVVTAAQNLGTTTAFDLPFITNNTERMRINTTGSVGIGSSAFNATNPERLLVDGGTSTSNNLIRGQGNINNNLQFSITNIHGGQNARTDIVAYANNGNSANNFIDMGINSGGYSNATIIGTTNTAYLYSTGNNFVIGNASSNKNVIFINGGIATTNEVMRIDASGEVGIATSTPSAKLDVSGNFKLGASGTVMSSMIKSSFSLSDNTTNITNTSSLTKTASVTGASLNASVIVNPRSALPQGLAIAYAFISAANTITVNIINSGAGTAGAQKLGNITFDVTIINP